VTSPKTLSLQTFVKTRGKRFQFSGLLKKAEMGIRAADCGVCLTVFCISSIFLN